MKKRLWKYRYVFLVFALLTGAALIPLLYMVVGVMSSMRSIRQQEAQMQQPAKYVPVAKELALFCQSFGQEFSDLGPNAGRKEWLPNSVQDLPLEFWSTESNSIGLICGGGFYHYGYFLERDQDSPVKGDIVWHLYLEREDQPNLLLTNVRLPQAAKISLDDFIRTTLSHYKRALKDAPRDRGLNQQQLFFSLKFVSRQEAQKNLKAAIQAEPGYWWPRFALDCVENRSAPVDQEDQFETWVSKHPSFSHYGYLVWLYRLEDKPVKAAEAAEIMLKLKPSDEPDANENFYYRSWCIAAYFYQERQYNLVLRICDMINPYFKDDENTSGPFVDKFKALKNACEAEKKPPVEQFWSEIDQDLWLQGILGEGTLKVLLDSKP